jgi:hypothetical protein
MDLHSISGIPGRSPVGRIFASIIASNQRHFDSHDDPRAICNHSRMTNLVNLDRVAHRNLRVTEELAFSVCKDLTSCAVSLNEIARLVIEYPIVFGKNDENGQYVCIALFGISPDRNLYWNRGSWNSHTVPMNVGRQPFFVALSEPTGGESPTQQGITCIDMDNPGVQTTDGEPLFDDSGEYSAYLRHKMNLLAELVDGERRSRLFTSKAEELGLIHAIQLEIKMPGGETRKFSGLYSIDERKLRALDAASLAELNANGYLHAMYAMLSSLGHLQILARRATEILRSESGA